MKKFDRENIRNFKGRVIIEDNGRNLHCELEGCPAEIIFLITQAIAHLADISDLTVEEISDMIKAGAEFTWHVEHMGGTK